MSRDLDSLAHILITLCELEKSVILSPSSREQVSRLKEQIEQEISLAKHAEPATA